MADRKNKAFRFLVSQEFIDIAADAIAMQTKKTCRFSTFRSAVETCCACMNAGQFDGDDFDAFIRTTQLEGDVRVYLNMHGSWSQHYEALKARLSAISNIRVFDRTMIAYLLHIAVKNDLY